MNKEDTKLLMAAKKARNNAYAPFSNYKVGAAVLTKKGNIYAGCNVESATYTLSTHAEMNAIDTAVTNGEFKIKKIAIILDSPEALFPCALCRQKIMEFSDDAEVISGTLAGKIAKAKISELYPAAFTKKNLGN